MTALIRGICKMQLAVRIDKRPGESHTALDGKKLRGAEDLSFWIKLDLLKQCCSIKLDFFPHPRFFSVQRLHGFRQVVQHVQLHVAK